MLELVDEFNELKTLHSKILRSMNSEFKIKSDQVTSIRSKIQRLVRRNLTDDDVVDIVESLNSDLNVDYLTLLVKFENRCIQDEAQILKKINLERSQFLKLVELTKFLREKDSERLNDFVLDLVNDLKNLELKKIDDFKKKISNFKETSDEETLEQAREILRFSKNSKIPIDNFKDLCYNKLYKILTILGDSSVQSESDSDIKSIT